MTARLSRFRRTIAAGAGLTVAAGVLAVVATPAGATAYTLPNVTNLRAGGNVGYDRVVVDLTKSGAKIRTQWVSGAYNCASGDKLYVPGKKFLEIYVEPARGYNDAGTSTYVGPGRLKSASFGLKNLKGVRMTCDFEGQVSFVLGFDHKAAVSTGTLTGPHRLYVDVKH
ncbi:MAG: AMIN-like domain-containing (lipo)protein [Sporichthyaceae bacterium]